MKQMLSNSSRHMLNYEIEVRIGSRAERSMGYAIKTNGRKKASLTNTLVFVDGVDGIRYSSVAFAECSNLKWEQKRTT